MNCRWHRFVKRYEGWLFVSPALAVLFFVLFYPLVNAIWISLSSLSPQLVTKFVGLENFKRVFDYETHFFNGLKNSAVFTVSSVALHLVIGMALALLLNAQIRARTFFRIAFLTPWMVAPVVVGVTWTWLLNVQYGIINYILFGVHIIREYVPWLAHPKLAMLSVIIANAWRGTPYVMLMILAGLQAIPKDLYEAAAVDGTTKWQTFWYVTIPSIRYVLAVALVLDTIWAFKFFDLIAVMTAGGPGRATEVLPVLIYKTSFDYYDFGTASALAVMMFCILLVVSLGYLKALRAQGEAN